MSLTSNDIDKVARLAKLSVAQEQRKALQDKLNVIVGLVEQLNQANTDGVAPLSHPLDQTQPLRNDTVTEANQRDALQALAPATQDHLYIVPAAIDES